MMTKYLFLVLLCPFLLSAQPSSKAVKYYQLAQKELQKKNKEKALALLHNAVALDTIYKDAHLALYFIYLSKPDIDLALKHIGIAARVQDKDQAKLLFNAGKTALQYGKYEMANQNLMKYLRLNSKDSVTRRSAMHMLENVQFSLAHLKEIKPLATYKPGKINTNLPEYLPSIDAAGHRLVFTRRIRGQEDLFIANGEDTSWTNVQPWPQNTNQNEGAHVISADGKTIVFTRCNADGLGSCDLYISEFKNSLWTKPMNLDLPINSVYWESQPSLSANGKTIYFVSNRPGGLGGYDIWKSDKIGKNWSRPVNAGKSINTEWDELSPCLHPDGEHLYFRSNGWPGFGSFDLFVSRKNETKAWNTPRNLGFQINDYSDQGAMAVGIDGHTAFLTTQEIDEQQNLINSDIVLFNLDEEISSFPCIYIQGTVREALTGASIPGATIIFTSEINVERKDSVHTDQDGEYLIVLPRQDKVQLFIVADKYNFQTDRIIIDSFSKARVQYDIALTPVSVSDSVIFSKSIILKNVLFELSSSTLLEESYTELDKVIKYLSEHPSFKIDILGHTDNLGNQASNLLLSTKRAQAVYTYILSKNINPLRLRYQGYGDTQPIVPNDSEAHRALNRRVEIKLSK